ncbi:class I SAM-dependent methyltransferase [Mesorhizobium abyssinicae]|uniref:class I SAM-dependent methyltransferase n=1 Tax=Mesorhizobium abyssinicae TaxID=1209958 RepID=UPI0033961D38
MGIEEYVPEPLRDPYRRLRSVLKNGTLAKSNSEIFNSIYKTAIWGKTEDGAACSGSGSYDPSVATYVAFVKRFITDNSVASIVEIGCGDFEIGHQYADYARCYLGVDVSSFVIEKNREKFGRDGISFEHFDASKRDIPRSDLCIIRQVLQHLDNNTIADILARTTAHKFVLITEHLPAPSRLKKPNLNKWTGPDTRVVFNSGVYVDLPPFGREGTTVLSLPVANPQAGPGEEMRTTLLVNP